MKISIKDIEDEIVSLERRKDKLIRVLSLRREVQALEEGVMPAMGHERIIKTVTETICQFFDVSVDDLKSKTRREDVARPRQVVFFICRQIDPHISYEKLATTFGNRNHGTAIHALKRVQDLIETDIDLAQKVADCTSHTRLRLSANGNHKPTTNSK